MTRSSSPRRTVEAQFRRRSSTSVVSLSSRCRGRGPSRSSLHATRSRTLWTVLRCCVSVSCNVASAGRSLGSSSGSWNAAGRWGIPAIKHSRSSSSASAYRMRSIVRFRLCRKACLCHAFQARSPHISRAGYLSNTPAFLAP